MIFLASPYSSPDRTILKTRFLIAQNFVIHAAKEWGIQVYSPIVYWHPLAELGSMPTDAGFWYNFNVAALRRADEVWFLELRGCEDSKGMKVERNLAKLLRLPMRRFGEDFLEIIEVEAVQTVN